MVQLPKQYNTPNNKEKMGDFSAIPANDYLGMIKKSEYKQTKKKDGHYLQLQNVILEGKYKGRILFERLNLDNPNPVAVEIANKTLNTICDACEKIGVQDSSELHGISFIMTVSVKSGDKVNPPSNDIKFYRKPKPGEVPADADEVSTEVIVVGNDKSPETVTQTKTDKLPWE